MAFVFEDQQPRKKSRYVFEEPQAEPQPEGIISGAVVPILKAIPRVAAHTAASMMQMPVSGIAALAKLVTSGGDLNAANAVLEQNQKVLDDSYLTTPEERAGSENIGLAMKPFQMAGEGWRQIGEASGVPYAAPTLATMGESAAMLALPKAGKAAKARGVPSDMNVFYPERTPAAARIVPNAAIGTDAAKSRFSPELAAQLVEAKGQPLALPPGQDFTLQGEPYNPTARLIERDAPTALALPPPEGMGEGFVSRPGKEAAILRKAEPSYTAGTIPAELVVEYKPKGTKAGSGYKTEANAEKAALKVGLKANEFEVVPMGDGFGYRKARYVFEDEKAPEVPPEPAAAVPPLKEQPPGTTVEPAASEIVQPGANLKRAPSTKGPENLVTFLERAGGVNFGESYNLKELKQFPDAKRVSRRGGMALDEAAEQANEAGILAPDGKPWDADRLAEALKTGDGRKSFPAEKADDIIARQIRREEREWIERQLAEIEPDPGEVVKSADDLKRSAFDEIKAEGFDIPDEEAALREIGDFFDEVANKTPTNETGNLPGMSAAETFDLSNPTTEWGKMQPKDKGPGTSTLFSGIDPTQITTTLKGLRENISQTKAGAVARGIGQEIHSPEVILKREPAGAKIYETADRADIEKNAFLAREGNEFEAAMKEAGLKIDTEASARVGAALDGRMPPEALGAGERKAFDFFKKKFHFLIQEAGKRAAGDADTYRQALSLAARKVRPQEKVEDLSLGQRNHYKGLKSPEEKAAYLHERWKETQPENLVKSYDILSRELKNYLPHIFDKEMLLDMFQTEAQAVEKKLRLATAQQSITQFKTRLKELESAILTIQGGGFVKYEALPRNVRFKFFESRKGKEGYSFDVVKAYQTYLTGIARKMFDEPAMKQMAMDYEGLSPELKPYADWYLRRFSGTLRTNKALDGFANAVSSFQWIRTLGFNPRSAMVNLSQRVNTIAEVGVKNSIKGEKLAFTEEGKRLFDSTGLSKEVPQVLYEGGAASLEKLRAVAGWMFRQVELGNRRHAFLSAYAKAVDELKMQPEAAVRYAENIVHKTQFRYGRIGMPKALSSAGGRIAFQFMSYPIKQIELLSDWAKNDPAKLVKYLAMAEGGNLILQEFLDTDMSNALGIGINMGEALNVLKDASKGDLREAWRHARLALQPGSGLLPSGFGPTITSAGRVAASIPEGKAGDTLKKELTPVVAARLVQAYDAVKGERGGKYPILSTTGHPTAKLTGRQLIQRTIGPKTETEHQGSLDYSRRTGLEVQRKDITREIIGKFLDGDVAGARSLVRSSGVMPSMEQIEAERMRRKFTREEIGKSKPARLTRPQEYQLKKEGRLIY
jgi:hypothetical protein